MLYIKSDVVVVWIFLVGFALALIGMSYGEAVKLRGRRPPRSGVNEEGVTGSVPLESRQGSALQSSREGRACPPGFGEENIHVGFTKNLDRPETWNTREGGS
jgi:hypothetical protein